MKELPILFSTPMVQAILEDRKKMTRRTKGLEKVNENPDVWFMMETNSGFVFEVPHHPDIDTEKISSPVQIGDKLWVKETSFYQKGDLGITYKADYTEAELKTKPSSIKWTPSLFMKKEHARIWLEVTKVRCERLICISKEDSIFEGILPLSMSYQQLIESGQKYLDYSKPKQMFVDGLDPQQSFRTLWTSINDDSSWSLNPWVFIYEFKRIERP